MAQSIAHGYVSADSHVVEPRDLWTIRMDKRFRDRAPRVESRPDGDYYLIDGLPAEPFSGLEGTAMEDKIKGGIEAAKGYRHEDTRPGAWDFQARLKDQELDNVRAEVIYQGILGLNFFCLPDPEYQRECIRVYNDWLSENCAIAPDRFLGVAMLPLSVKGPIQWAVDEALRVARKGLRSVEIPAEVPERRYGDPYYEPLWAALEDLGLPLSMHVSSSTAETAMGRVERMGMGIAIADGKIGSPMRAISDLIWGAVAQKHPRLRFVMAEGGIGWIASLFSFIDHWWVDHRRWIEPRLEEAPSFYFKRQFWATFEEDRAGLLTRELLNVDHLMWGADYPHTEGTFPHSREAVAKVFAGIPDEEVRKMTADNCARLYGLSR